MKLQPALQTPLRIMQTAKGRADEATASIANTAENFWHGMACKQQRGMPMKPCQLQPALLLHLSTLICACYVTCRQGYNSKGFDRFDKQGYDKEGFNRWVVCYSVAS
jgi:hypothetical protein